MHVSVHTQKVLYALASWMSANWNFKNNINKKEDTGQVWSYVCMRKTIVKNSCQIIMAWKMGHTQLKREFLYHVGYCWKGKIVFPLCNVWDQYWQCCKRQEILIGVRLSAGTGGQIAIRSSERLNPLEAQADANHPSVHAHTKPDRNLCRKGRATIPVCQGQNSYTVYPSQLTLKKRRHACILKPGSPISHVLKD